jgi:ribonucleoside-diphosphate reductase alpha chain
MNMQVTKRNGVVQEVSFDKIKKRIQILCNDFNVTGINQTNLAIKVIDQLYDKIPTCKIDELTAEHCAYSSAIHPSYSTLAGVISVSNIHKTTNPSVVESVTYLYQNTNIISEQYYNIITKYNSKFDDMLVHSRDYLIDYFGFKTLERAYLIKHNDKIIERIQHMFLRVAIQVHGDNLELIKETYDLLSTKQYIHASPTLFNSGTRFPQLSSCYLIALQEDSLDGIFDTLKECAQISKWSGGIGLHIHNIRSKNSLISSTNGKTTGIAPMLRVFNDTAKYINQGGKRNGSIAVYMEPWHADIEDFLELKKNHGDEESKARDLFYGLWVPNLFMERVEKNESWSLFCPKAAPGLSDVYGSNFNELYVKYEELGYAHKQINARTLWLKILDSQMETGNPYILYKDHCNEKSNQKNLGTIKSSNLCTEIVEYSDPTQSAVCNLSSIVLPNYVTNKTFDYEKLYKVTKIITTNLNKIIDVNYYPNSKTRRSNFLNRPIGIGVQGLADVFILMDIAYHSEEAIEINKLIFETIYYASLERSMEISKERTEYYTNAEYLDIINEDYIDPTQITRNPDEKIITFRNSNNNEVMIFLQKELNNSTHLGSYSSFIGSPASKGILQFDMWNIKPNSNLYDWDLLKQRIQQHGLRNSLLVAPMPTASTSQIFGYNECFEPLTSNIYTRRTLAGEFILTNKYLMNDLLELGLWNEQLKNNIILNKGSVAHLTCIPEHIRNKYKVVWEIPMKHLIDMSADRGAYICQSQSLNLWMEDPTYNKLTSMHLYSFKKGLKTAIYYLRRKAKHAAQQFTIEPDKLQNNNNNTEEDYICESCSA